jgi:MraZ protein
MFRGENKVTLDAKGRLAMPTRYREGLAEDASGRLVVTIDHVERCLLIYTQPDWEDIERKLSKLPALDPRVRSLQRLMIGHASDVEMDSQGRVLIPPNLREFAGLQRDVVLSGQGTRFELWDEALWSEQRDTDRKLQQDGQGLSPELSSISF